MFLPSFLGFKPPLMTRSSFDVDFGHEHMGV